MAHGWADDDRRREYQREWQRANRERVNAKVRAHRAANREVYLERDAQYREANRDKIRAYYQANRPKIRAAQRKYAKANRGRLSATQRLKTHGVDDAAWAAMWQRQDGCCYLCGREMDPAEAVIEHWHGCGLHPEKHSCPSCRRGLAHSGCNTVVGLAADDPDLLRVIADRLEEANASVRLRQASAPVQLTIDDTA
jgi:hypothetical protein